MKDSDKEAAINGLLEIIKDIRDDKVDSYFINLRGKVDEKKYDFVFGVDIESVILRSRLYFDEIENDLRKGVKQVIKENFYKREPEETDEKG